MNNNISDISSDNNVIELTVPFRADFVSIIRLTASGVANSIGFDIDTIEDIKVAIAEVCNKFINIGSKITSTFSIKFHIYPKELFVTFDCKDKALKCIFDDDTDGLGISIINALMDNVEYCPNDKYLFSMSKTLEGEV